MPADQLDLRLLKYFVKTAEHLNFTAAARECGVSQSALSQGIQQLERRIGLPLFDRGDRHVALSAPGSQLLARARRLLADAADAEAALRAFASGEEGALRVGVVQTVNALVIPLLLPELSSAAPGARFDIRELPAPQIEEAVAAGELEVGVSFHPVTRATLELAPLASEDLLLIRARQRRARTAPHRPLDPGDVLRQPLALLHQGYCTRHLIDRAFAAAGLEPSPALEMNSVTGLLHVVAHSRYATILPALALRMAPPGHVEGIPIAGLELRRRLVLVRRHGGFRSPLAEAFAAALKRALSSGPPNRTRAPHTHAKPPARA